MRLRQTSVAFCLLLGACATTPAAPTGFRLIDENNTIHEGALWADSRLIEVTLGESRYRGFYIVATSMATVDTWPSFRHGFPRESVAIVNGNTAKAHLSSDNGEHLNCDLIFQGKRIIGECKSPQGKTYQLVAGDAAK